MSKQKVFVKGEQSARFPGSATPEETQEGVVPVETTVVEAPAAPVSALSSTPASPTGPVDLGTLRTKFSPQANAALAILEDYFREMAPGVQVGVSAGARQQVMFYGAMLTIINDLDDSESAQLVDILVKLFRQHSDGALADTHALRFIDEVQLSSDDISAWSRLVHFFREFSAPGNREAASRRVRVQYSLELGLTDTGRDRLVAHFRL